MRDDHRLIRSSGAPPGALAVPRRVGPNAGALARMRRSLGGDVVALSPLAGNRPALEEGQGAIESDCPWPGRVAAARAGQLIWQALRGTYRTAYAIKHTMAAVQQ